MEDIDWAKFLGRKSVSKSEVARQLGVPPAMVTEWAKGKANPTYKYLKRLADIGMTAQEMFGDETAGTLIKNSSGEQSEKKIKLTDEDLSRAFLRAAQILGGEKKEDK